MKALIISAKTTTYSDSDGSFSVAFSELISVDTAGYLRVQLNVDTLILNVIRLQPLSCNLSEVSITAYSTPGKLRSVPGAVSVISSGPFQNAGVNDLICL